MSAHRIRLLIDHVTIAGRTHAAGDVVEVDHRQRKALVERGHAVDFGGEARVQTNFPGEHDAPASRARRVERATRL